MDHNVMLVEGNRLMLEKLSNTIRETDGFSLAVRYQDVSEALGQGGMFHPDLILLDVEQSGARETLVEFRRVFRETPIICSVNAGKLKPRADLFKKVLSAIS